MIDAKDEPVNNPVTGIVLKSNLHTILAPKKKEKVKFLLRKNSFGNNFDIQNRRSGFYGILSAPYLNNKTPTSLTHGISDVNRYRLILFT